MERVPFDALFVASQNVGLKQIAKTVKSENFSSIFILPTYFLFPSEEKTLRESLGGCRVKILSMGGFLMDNEMLKLDEEAFKKYSSGNKITPYTAYVAIEELVYLKNKTVHGKLLQKYSFGKIYYSASSWVRVNLGVSKDYWQEQGGVNLMPKHLFLKKRISHYLLTLRVFRFLKKVVLYFQMLLLSRTAWVLNWKGEHFIFHSLKRLRFIDDVEFKKLNYRGVRYFNFFKSNCREKILERFEKSLSLTGRTHFASPLHQFSHFYFLAGDFKKLMYIFVDGYRPSNYSPYSYVHYFPYGVFVSRDQNDYSLITFSGRTAIKPFGFLRKSYFEIPKINEKTNLNTIVLSLNHAGDWSCLVDRSDTDVLIYSFSRLSQKYKSKEFIIRLHPTMALPQHEGLNSKKRIENLVEEMNFENLSVSKVSLEEDWNRGDIFVTEYSLSALDAMRYGKICLFVNLTKRRSFVQDFVDLGFPQAKGEKEFFLKIEDMFSNSIKYQKVQIAAAKKYNGILKDFLKE